MIGVFFISTSYRRTLAEADRAREKGTLFMNSSFENKVALVTGAASRIGLAAAVAFAAEGAAVVLRTSTKPRLARPPSNW